MKPINLLEEFEPEKVYLYLDENYKKKLLDKAIKKSSSQSLLAKNLSKYFKNRRLSQSLIANWIIHKNLRFDEIKAICKYLREKLDNNYIRGIKGQTTTQLIMNPKLKINLTPELAALIANFYCDGCIEYRNGFISQYTGINKGDDKKLIKEFKSNFKKVFGEMNFSIHKSKHNKAIGIRVPCFIGKLLFYKFNIYNNKIPIQVKKSSKKIKSAYLRAVFDDEGTVHKQHAQVRLKMKYLCFVKDVKDMLEKDFEIKCSKIAKEISKGKYIAHLFTISGLVNQKRFYERIGFIHPKKNRALKLKIENVLQENYGYGAKEFVYSTLEKHRSKTAKEIAILIKRDRRTVKHHLDNLKKQNRVKFEKLKRKFVYEYLWSTKNENINNYRKTFSNEAYS